MGDILLAISHPPPDDNNTTGNDDDNEQHPVDKKGKGKAGK
jgi:hypothetical protein